jgi:long-subunit fatty acid transport protein
MQGVGAVNMSMGGAATAQPLDISGAIHWNPATVSTFDGNIIKLDLGLFFSSPELSSSLPAGALGTGAPAIIKNAVQIGLSYQPTEKIGLDTMYHHGASDGKTSGLLLNPSAITPSNELGEVPGTSVSYEMTTDLISVGISYTFN